jgi:hypothetical protein
MALDDTTVIIIVAVVVIIAVAASSTIILTMRRRLQPQTKKGKLQKEQEADPYLAAKPAPFSVSKSIGVTDASQAKDELRILELEKEILGDAIRRLYEAHAEGKINEQERERLAANYKNRMLAVKDSMAKDETTVALYELESMEEDLMKLFRERFGELNSKVEELRGRIDVRTVKEVKIQMPKPQTPVMPQMEEEEEGEETEAETKEKTQQVKKRKPPVERQTQKTEAELRIEDMRNKIDEVMNKLGQMEMES